MIGKNIKAPEISGSNRLRTACVDRAIHVTFKGTGSLISEREDLICTTSCDCALGEVETGGENVEFSRSAKAVIEGHLHTANTR